MEEGSFNTEIVAAAKVCSRCGISKDLSQFGIRVINTDGLQKWCVECDRQYKMENLKRKREDAINNKKELAKLREEVYRLHTHIYDLGVENIRLNKRIVQLESENSDQFVKLINLTPDLTYS